MNIRSSDLQSIREAIERQIAAFREDDAVVAFSQAAPGIQRQFGSAENFVRMVEEAYPPVYRPRSVVFESVLDIEGLPAQQVMVMGEDGELVRATYIMQQQVLGDWKIAGCYLTPLDESA